MMNLDLLEMNFKYNSFIKSIKPIYEKKERFMSFIDYLFDVVLNKGIFYTEIKDIDIIYDEDKLKIFNNDIVVLDIMDFIKDYFFKIDYNERRYSTILRRWFNKVDQNYILNNEQIFIASLQFKQWPRIILEVYLNNKPELKRTENKSEEFNYFWTNICRYQNVDVNFIQKYIGLILTRNKYCFLLRGCNSHLFNCHESIRRRIFKKADKYTQEIWDKK